MSRLRDENGQLWPARAFHDLVGVRVIEVSNWGGPHEVRAHRAGDQLVEIQAPRRHEGERWTFAPQQDGVLKCFSEPGLPASAEPMLVLLPADRIDGIVVRFRDA